VIPSFAGKPTLTLAVPAGLNGTIAFDAGPPSTIRASIALALNRSQPIDGTRIVLGFTGQAGVDVLVPVAPLAVWPSATASTTSAWT